MKYVVFDIETTDTFASLSERNITLLNIAIVGAYDSTTNAYTSYTVEELPGLWPILEATDALVGFNSDTFDIPLLNKYYPGNLETLKSIDILTDVHRALGRRIRLNSLAEATLGEGKSADGLKAIEWWQKGEIDKVREYCLQDVKVTKDLFEYARKHGSVKYKDLKDIKEIKLNTANWENGSGGAITHTLPF